MIVGVTARSGEEQHQPHAASVPTEPRRRAARSSRRGAGDEARDDQRMDEIDEQHDADQRDQARPDDPVISPVGPRRSRARGSAPAPPSTRMPPPGPQARSASASAKACRVRNGSAFCDALIRLDCGGLTSFASHVSPECRDPDLFRSVFRLIPSSSAVRTWLPRVADRLSAISGSSISRRIRSPPVRRQPSPYGRNSAQMRPRSHGRAAAAGIPADWRPSSPRRNLWVITAPEIVVGAEHAEPAHEVLELAHIARPVLLLQDVERSLEMEVLRGSPSPSALAGRPAQVRNVVQPLAQGRQADRHHVQPIEQVLAEPALVDQRTQI